MYIRLVLIVAQHNIESKQSLNDSINSTLSLCFHTLFWLVFDQTGSLSISAVYISVASSCQLVRPHGRQFQAPNTPCPAPHKKVAIYLNYLRNR